MPRRAKLALRRPAKRSGIGNCFRRSRISASHGPSSVPKGREMRAIDYFDKGAEAFPGRIAIIDRATQYSYREMQEASHKIACAMWAKGLRGEERAAIFSPNDARILLCMLGMMRAGAVWVPVNHRNALDANVQFLKYSGTSWLFYHS